MEITEHVIFFVTEVVVFKMSYMPMLSGSDSAFRKFYDLVKHYI